MELFILWIKIGLILVIIIAITLAILLVIIFVTEVILFDAQSPSIFLRGKNNLLVSKKTQNNLKKIYIIKEIIITLIISLGSIFTTNLLFPFWTIYKHLGGAGGIGLEIIFTWPLFIMIFFINLIALNKYEKIMHKFNKNKKIYNMQNILYIVISFICSFVSIKIVFVLSILYIINFMIFMKRGIERRKNINKEERIISMFGLPIITTGMIIFILGLSVNHYQSDPYNNMVWYLKERKEVVNLIQSGNLHGQQFCVNKNERNYDFNYPCTETIKLPD